MMNITDSTIVRLEDPFGILPGQRYEIYLSLDFEEDDELYSEHGIMLKLIYAVEEETSKIAQYNFIEKTTENYLDFALEDDEEKEIEQFCQQLVEKI